MQSRWQLVIAMLVAVMVTSCAAISKHGPYRYTTVQLAEPIVAPIKLDEPQPSFSHINAKSRLLVAPVNLLDPVLLYMKPHHEMVRASIERYVESAGHTVVKSQVFVDTWHELLQGSNVELDPLSQQFDQDLYNRMLLNAIRTVAQKTEVDAIVFPNVSETTVMVSQSRGSWFGVERQVEIKNILEDKRNLRMANPNFIWNGSLNALSLNVDVVNSDGVLLYQGKAGLDFVQEVVAMPKDGNPYAYDREARIQLKNNPLPMNQKLMESIQVSLQPLIGQSNSQMAAKK